MPPDGGDCEQVIAQLKKAGIDNAALARSCNMTVLRRS
jgi:hypothetical protein